MNYTSQKGFTFIEIMVAVMIMSVGFIALAQMQYVSLRQKYKAELGTTATNILQFAQDSDIAKAKMMQRLNAIVLIDTLAQRTPDYSYCGDPDVMGCEECPCNPLTAFTPTPVESVDPEITCSVVDINDYDPYFLLYTDEATCRADMESLGSESMVVVKSAILTEVLVDAITVQTLSLVYAVKSMEQFYDTGLTVSLHDTLASQAFEVTAHIDNFNEGGAISSNPSGWIDVRVPHLP